MFKELKNLSKNPKVREIIVFGSAAKGKRKPGDVDVAIITEEKLRFKELSPRFHAVHLTYEELLSTTIFKTLLSEGVTLKGKPFSERFGIKPMILYWYDLAKLDKIRKVRFSHALFGRKNNGLLREAGGKNLGKGAIIVPVSKDEIIKDFFKTWKINFYRARIFMEATQTG